MKTFLSLILFAIISLSETARPNIRFLRSIPNRNHRTVTNRNNTDTPSVIKVSGDDKSNNQKPDEETIVVHSQLYQVLTACVNSILINYDLVEDWDELHDIIVNSDENTRQANGYQLCNGLSPETLYLQCLDCIDKAIQYFFPHNSP